MPIDTRNKRASALGRRMPWGRYAPVADGDISSQADRLQLAGHYATTVQKVSPLSERDDSPVGFFGCDGANLYRANPNFGIAFGGGYDLQRPLLYNSMISRPYTRFHAMTPHGYTLFRYPVSQRVDAHTFKVPSSAHDVYPPDDHTLIYTPGLAIEYVTVVNNAYTSGANNGFYTVVDSTFDTPDTLVEVVEAIPSATITDGYIQCGDLVDGHRLQISFNVGPYFQPGVLQPADSILRPDIHAGDQYLNELYRDVFAAVKLVRPELVVGMHFGLYGMSRIQLESNRHWDPATDSDWMLESLDAYKAIGFNGAATIDAASALDGFIHGRTNQLRQLPAPMRIGYEGVSITGPDPYDLDLESLALGPCWGSLSSYVSLWTHGASQWIAPRHAPYHEAIVCNDYPGLLDADHASIRVMFESLVRRGFVPGTLYTAADNYVVALAATSGGRRPFRGRAGRR